MTGSIRINSRGRKEGQCCYLGGKTVKEKYKLATKPLCCRAQAYDGLLSLHNTYWYTKFDLAVINAT